MTPATITGDRSPRRYPCAIDTSGRLDGRRAWSHPLADAARWAQALLWARSLPALPRNPQAAVSTSAGDRSASARRAAVHLPLPQNRHGCHRQHPLVTNRVRRREPPPSFALPGIITAAGAHFACWRDRRSALARSPLSRNRYGASLDLSSDDQARHRRLRHHLHFRGVVVGRWDRIRSEVCCRVVEHGPHHPGRFGMKCGLDLDHAVEHHTFGRGDQVSADPPEGR